MGNTNLDPKMATEIRSYGKLTPGSSQQGTGIESKFKGNLRTTDPRRSRFPALGLAKSWQNLKDICLICTGIVGVVVLACFVIFAQDNNTYKNRHSSTSCVLAFDPIIDQNLCRPKFCMPACAGTAAGSCHPTRLGGNFPLGFCEDNEEWPIQGLHL